MSELIRLITKLRGVSSDTITEDDIARSIATLQPLRAGYQVVDVGGRKMIRSVVKELDEDQTVVLVMAREEGGKVVEEKLVREKGWTRERTRAALENMLLRDGLCWLDDQDDVHGRAYWIPSAMQWDL